MNKHTGTLFVFLAALLYSIGGLCIKVIPWSGMSINGGRTAIALVVLGVYLAVIRHRPRFNRWVFLGSLCIFGTNTLFSLANKLTTAANTIVLQFTAPVFVILFSALFWKKKPQKLDLAACAVDLGLQPVQKPGGFGAVHLGVVELEGQGQPGPEPFPAVAAPDQEGIVVDAGVDVHRAVDPMAGQSRSADHHIVIPQLKGAAGAADPAGQGQIVPVEADEAVRDGDVAGVDAAAFQGHHRVDGQLVVLHQLIPHRQQGKLRGAGRRPPDAPAQQHMEFEMVAPAQPQQGRHVQRLEQRQHGHGRAHPDSRSRPRGLARVDFSGHGGSSKHDFKKRTALPAYCGLSSKSFCRKQPIWRLM